MSWFGAIKLLPRYEALPTGCRFSQMPGQETRVQELEEFAREVARYAGNAGDDYLAGKARAVLNAQRARG